MAEVEKMTAAPPTDIPVSSPNASEAGGGSSSTAELGTSPNQEPSSNSHPHDSEYDTASDLEGGEDYDDDDDESGSEEDSETDDDDVGSETTEDDRHSGTVSGNDNAQDRSVADSEAQKKVDEDRSNPQYIPKRGTFYEHDDRTAETEGGPVIETENSSQTLPESNGDVNGISVSGAPPSGQPSNIAQAPKTVKQWPPTTGASRWSHDRFEANEQGPKSRAELLQSYGYDIRNEDAPPRARRRRRYTRGPSKYSRNWEDEQAYLKASNKERKPPRPQDFPALNERKPRRPRTSSFRDEKENRRSERGADKPQGGGGGGGVGGASGSNPVPRSQEVERERERDRDREREREPKNRHYGRVNGGPGRQNPMEFKPKSNRGPPPDRRERGDRGDRERGERGERGERDREQEHVDQRNERPHQKPSTPRSNGQGKQSGDGPTLQQSQQQPPPPQQQQRQSPQQVQQPPLAAPQTQLSTTNLSQRLQQVQQRNDPSHVGSVQMHSLASQNQQQQQLQLTQQAQPAAPEPRTAPKRYSSLRRSQQEASQHLAEQQQQQLQQQLHLQQQQQQQQQPSQIMIQDPHVLMQFAYQQQEIQAQLQTLQLGPAAAAVPAPPKQHAPPPAAYPQPQGAPYYVTGAEPVPVQVPVTVSVPPASPYVNPASAAYLPTTPAAVAFAQAQTSVVTQPQPQPPAQPPTPAAAAQAPPSMNFHQNYNTVGGTTYFVPPVQTTSRPAALPQRRPTNAIPILPPSEKHKTRSGPNANQTKEEGGHADNIDHIIDNMFVQRPAFQPPPTGEAAAAGAKEDVANSNPIIPTLAAAEQNLQPVPAVGQE